VPATVAVKIGSSHYDRSDPAENSTVTSDGPISEISNFGRKIREIETDSNALSPEWEKQSRRTGNIGRMSLKYKDFFY